MNKILYTNAVISEEFATISKDMQLINPPHTMKDMLLNYAKKHTIENGSIKNITFEICSNFAPESYHLSITANRILISASDQAGLFYGANTLYRAMQEKNLHLLEIDDNPLIKVRGFKLYLPSPDATGLQAFKDTVDFLALFKYNFIMLEIGGAMEFKTHPEINQGWIEYSNFMNEYSGKPLEIQNSFPWRKNSIHTTNGGGQVVPQSMVLEMIDYAQQRHFEVVPEMPSLSHCDYLLTRHKELAERSDDPYPDACCPNHPDYYKLLFELFDEVISVFQPKVMHIGHDEYYSFAICPRCKDKKPEDIYADDINKCINFLKSRNVETMIWGDKLLDAHYPNGIGCGGAEILDNENGYNRHIPALYPAINKLPDSLQIMHWYWSIDRDLENNFTKRNMPLIFGNMSLRNFPDWTKRRQASNVQGICISNWGNTDFCTLQRNTIFFDLVSAAAWSWNSNLNSNDHYNIVRDWTLEELYTLRCNKLEPEYIELTHTCNFEQEYEYFFDGKFVDEEADLLGWHILKDDEQNEYKLPVIYGSNISADSVSFERYLPEKVDYNYDAYRLDMRLLEVSYGALPQKYENKTFYRTSWNNPAPGKKLKYHSFVAVEKHKDNLKVSLKKD